MRALQRFANLEIPSSWSLKPLGTILDLNYGEALPEEQRSNCGFPVFGSNGVVGHHTSALVGGPGIIVGRKGTTGVVAWSDGAFFPIDTTYYVVPLSGETSLRWLYYMLCFADLPRLAAATGVPGLSREDVYKLIIPCPPEDEQTVISLALTLVDSCISATYNSIAKVERLQKGLMQQVLSGKIQADGTPRQEKEFWDHPKLGRVPENWKVTPLRELADVQRGKFSFRPRNDPQFYGGPYPFIQTGEVSSSRGYISTHVQTLNQKGASINGRPHQRYTLRGVV